MSNSGHLDANFGGNLSEIDRDKLVIHGKLECSATWTPMHITRAYGTTVPAHQGHGNWLPKQQPSSLTISNREHKTYLDTF